MPIIDAHQHFWDPARADYPWMTGALAPIRRAFTPDDLRPELTRAGVSATILVQTRSSLDETREFLAIAAATDFVAGVVGWVDLTDPAVADTLAALQAQPDGRYLVGIRHQVHDEPDPEWLLRGDVRRGLAAVERHGLAYDLLLRPRELPAALRTVRDLPGLRFVVDHIAKPDIARGAHAAWAEAMEGFRPERSHVWCKLSGMVTEADWSTWTPADLAPYIHTALSVFGPDRCLFGSDWPVCLLAGSYEAVLAGLLANLGYLDDAARAQVLAGSAASLYRLSDATAAPHSR